MTRSNETTERDGTLHVGERVRLMRDGLVQNVALVVSGGVGLIMVPILLHGLGDRAYGLWLTATGLAALFACVDLGLGMSIMRQVAASEEGDTESFVVSAGNVYLLIGAAAGLAVVVTGVAMVPALKLDSEGLRQAPWVFALTGVGVLADLTSTFSASVLAGLRRFGIVSVLASAAVLTRALGFVVLLWCFSARLVVLVAWQAFASSLFALVSLAVVARVAPQFRLRLGKFDWRAVRSRTRFALANQTANVASTAMWRIPSVLVGVIYGTALVTPLSVAQRLPLTLELMLWRLTDVLVPTLSARARDREYVREVLTVGTRWTFVLALPVCVALCILAPEVLRAWIGVATYESVLIFRLATAAVMVEAAAHAAEGVLWGAGLIRMEIVVTVGRAVAAVALSACLIPRFGIVGAGAGIFVGILIGSAICLRYVTQHCRISLLTLAREGMRGLLVPVALCATVTWAAARFLPLRGWTAVACALAGGASGYLVALRFGAVRDEERTLARELIGLPLALARRLRRRAANDGSTRSG